MALSDPLSVTWYRYSRWARMRDWYSALPQTEEILIPSIGRLIRRGRLRADVGMMMRDALYHRDPMQGPPVPGRLPADEHKARRAALLDGGPPTP